VTAVPLFAKAFTEISPDGCWTWTGPLLPNGYAQTSHFGQSKYVHRLSWEKANGPIPDGLVVDHLCRNRACLNPEHLEVVSNWENLRRGNTLVAFATADHGDYLTTTQAAKRLGLPRTTVRSWIASGKLPVAKVVESARPCNLHLRSDVDALISSHKQAARIGEHAIDGHLVVGGDDLATVVTGHGA
jgi:excisionase family DNA binding protein